MLDTLCVVTMGRDEHRKVGGLLGERLPADRALLPQLVAVVEELPLGLPPELGEVGEVGEVGGEAQHPASKILGCTQEETRDAGRAPSSSLREVEAHRWLPEPPSCVDL